MSNDFLQSLENWCLESVNQTKQAEERGSTSHPSESADDGNQSASTGARASEHEKDVKSQVPGQSVNEAKGSDVAGPGRGENSATFNTGVKARATGEDASVETASAKDKPEDPGTSHPAKADMGEKFSFAVLKSMGDEILADVAVASAVVKSAAEVKADDSSEKDEPVAHEKAETKAEEKKEEAAEKVEEKAEAAGKEAAAAVIGALNQPVVSASEVIDSVVKQAALDAENVADFLAGYFSKQAEPEQPAIGGDNVMAETSEGAAGAGAPEGQGDEAEMEQVVQALLEAGMSPEELMALIQGQGAGAEAGAAPAGGAEIAAGAPEAAPAAGGI